MNAIFYENRSKIFLAYFFLLFISCLYIYNTYLAIENGYRKKSENHIISIYNFYKKINAKELLSQEINLENPDFFDNKEMVKEFIKSTPLFIEKGENAIPRYSEKISFFKKEEVLEKKLEKHLPDILIEDYKIFFEGEKVFLLGWAGNDGFILIEKELQRGSFESRLNRFFIFIAFFSFLSIFLFLYLLFGIRKNQEEKEFMEKKYKYLEEDIRKMAFEDKLTGAASRLKFEESLKDLIHIASRFEEQKFCLVIMDIDNFKSVNDTYGHDYGDVVLSKVAEAVKGHVRESDTFARWGGEEFVILLPLIDIKSALSFTDRIREYISKIDFEKIEKVTCSFGLVEYKAGDDPKSILKRADENLYAAKKSGKNKVVCQL